MPILATPSKSKRSRKASRPVRRKKKAPVQKGVSTRIRSGLKAAKPELRNQRQDKDSGMKQPAPGGQHELRQPETPEISVKNVPAKTKTPPFKKEKAPPSGQEKTAERSSDRKSAAEARQPESPRPDAVEAVQEQKAVQRPERRSSGGPGRSKPVRTGAAPVKASSGTSSKSAVSKKQTPKKEAVKKAPQAEGAEQAEKEIIKAPTDPKEDPAFLAVIKHTKKVRARQQHHDTPEHKREEVKTASKLPVKDQQTMKDQSGHMKTLDTEREKAKKEKKREPITAKNFVNTLEDKIKVLGNNLPQDEASAKAFKSKKPISNLKGEIVASVNAQNKKVIGTLAEETGKEKPPKNESGRDPEPPGKIIKGDVGKKPKPINSEAAVPKPKHDAEISMQRESRSLDDYMAANAMTEAQLAKSNEPEFLAALSSKKKAQAAAAAAPQRYRELEQAKLDGAKILAEKAGKKGFRGMFGKRSEIFGAVFDRQEKDRGTDSEKHKQDLKKLKDIYDSTKNKVSILLIDLSEKVNKEFSEMAGNAMQFFELYVEEKLDAIYGWTTWDDTLLGLVGVNNDDDIKEVFKEGKSTFISTIHAILHYIASEIIEKKLNEALHEIEKGKKASDGFFKTRDKEEQKLLKEAFDYFKGRYEDLEHNVYNKQEELADDLAESYKKNVAGLRESFNKIHKEVSTSWIAAAAKAVVGVAKTIAKLKSMLFDILGAAVDAIEVIIADPIGFVSNLFRGIKQGFVNFKEHIKKHLLSGFITWLSGSLKGLDISMPKDLSSPKSIFNLVAQVLGLSWDYFRSKAVKLLGKEAVMVMEESVEIFRIIKEKGAQGLWAYIKWQFNDLKESVMDAIKEMIISKVINAGINWVMGLLSPVGGFIKTVMLIKDIVVFFVEKASQVAELVGAFIESIRMVAGGNVAGVAKAIEDALVKAIPLLIGFLASLLGISGLTNKVQKIIKKMRRRIDRAINKLIRKVQKAFKKAMEKGKATVKAGAEKIVAWWKARREFRTKKGEKHELYFKGSGNSLTAMVASMDPEAVKVRLDGWMKEARRQDAPKDKKDAKPLINETKNLTERYEAAAKQQKKDSFGKRITANLGKLFDIFDVEVGAEVKSGEARVKPRVAWTTKALKVGPETNMVGMEMTADYLGPEHPQGSGPKDNTQADIFTLLPTPEKGVDANKAYIKGHLLNDNIGGPGEEKNLFPITGQANSDHKNKIENTLKDVINNKKFLVYYHVKVKQDGQPEPIGGGLYRINSQFICTAHTYKMPPEGAAATRLPKSDKEWKVAITSEYKGKVKPELEGDLETDAKKAKSDYKGEALRAPGYYRGDKARKYVENVEKQLENLKQQVKTSLQDLRKKEVHYASRNEELRKSIAEREKKLKKGDGRIKKENIKRDKKKIEERNADIVASEKRKKEGDNLKIKVKRRLEKARELHKEGKPENVQKIETIFEDVKKMVSNYEPKLKWVTDK